MTDKKVIVVGAGRPRIGLLLLAGRLIAGTEGLRSKMEDVGYAVDVITDEDLRVSKDPALKAEEFDVILGDSRQLPPLRTLGPKSWDGGRTGKGERKRNRKHRWG